MINEKKVVTFKNALSVGDKFELECENNYVWWLKSEKCVINFLFERYDEGLIIQFMEPNLDVEKNKPMHFLLLRFIRGACFDGEGLSDPEFYAKLIDTFFSDLLSGDFSVRQKYEEIEDEFFSKLLDVFFLPENHPAQVKVKNFDLSWMNEI